MDNQAENEKQDYDKWGLVEMVALHCCLGLHFQIIIHIIILSRSLQTNIESLIVWSDSLWIPGCPRSQTLIAFSLTKSETINFS